VDATCRLPFGGDCLILPYMGVGPGNQQNTSDLEVRNKAQNSRTRHSKIQRITAEISQIQRNIAETSRILQIWKFEIKPKTAERDIARHSGLQRKSARYRGI
jgi:hypothetical protein